ncbi:MAG: GntR family transcriptional regulator [Lachnospiraceae bacterium]
METLQEQAYAHLKNMIINGDLSYQEIYSETKLSKNLQISRTPFRDAMHRLMQEGFIDIIPSKGFCLHQLSAKDVTETFQVRSALECFCTLEITKQADTADAKKLFHDLDIIMKKLHEIMITTHSIKDFCTYDFEFHTKIIYFLKNEQFSSIFDSFMYRMQKLAQLSLSHENRMEETYAEHLAIFSSMKQGDVTHIYEKTLIHMNRPKGINLEDLTSLLGNDTL